ncbi:MAG: putative metal-binding motif-containing protein [Patescibacteria group bacterium]
MKLSTMVCASFLLVSLLACKGNDSGNLNMGDDDTVADDDDSSGGGDYTPLSDDDVTSDDDAGDDDAGGCYAGQVSCPCYEDNTCDPGLECYNSMCVTPGSVPDDYTPGDPCEPGSVTCTCYGNDTCNSGLTCASGLCVALPEDGEPPADVYPDCTPWDPDSFDPAFDYDGDGYPDAYGNGTDCRPCDPNSYTGAVELCGDNVDNDCDRVIDESCGDTSGDPDECFGLLRCSCYGNGTCNDDLDCVSGMCVDLTSVGDDDDDDDDTEPPCPAGAETCACYGNGTCDSGLTCASGRCVDLSDIIGDDDDDDVADDDDDDTEPPCPIGSETCPCTAGGFCDDGLTCASGLCVFVTSGGDTPTHDLDSDGFDAPADCNDHNDQINPDAEELCDGFDNNCNGSVDEDPDCGAVGDDDDDVADDDTSDDDVSDDDVTDDDTGDDDTDCPAGEETCLCLNDDSCDTGLTCASGLCVDLGDIGDDDDDTADDDVADDDTSDDDVSDDDVTDDDMSDDDTGDDDAADDDDDDIVIPPETDICDGDLVCRADRTGNGLNESLCLSASLFTRGFVYQSSDAIAVGDDPFSWSSPTSADVVDRTDGFFCMTFAVVRTYSFTLISSMSQNGVDPANLSNPGTWVWYDNFDLCHEVQTDGADSFCHHTGGLNFVFRAYYDGSQVYGAGNCSGLASCGS